MVYTDPMTEFIEHLSFWKELETLKKDQMKFSPFGISSILIPPFFRDVIQNTIQKIPISDFQYTDCTGNNLIKSKIVDCFSDLAHLEKMNPKNNVAVNLGAVSVIEQIALMCLAQNEDQMILFEPHYPYHFGALKVRGQAVLSHLVFNETRNEFTFDFKDLKNKLNADTRLIVLCNPNNPTTRIWKEDEYNQLTELLNKYPKVMVIEDCSYCVYVNQNHKKIKYFHEFGQNFEKTFTVFSAGKIFNTTGNRLGWSFASKTNTEKLANQMRTSNCPGALEQQIYARALEEALKEYEERKNFWVYLAEDIAHRIEYVVEKLAGFGVKSYPSEGTYYLLIDSIALSKNIEQKYFISWGEKPEFDACRDKAVCRKLVMEHKVGLLPLSPCYVFKPKYDHFIRIPCNRSYEDLDFMLKGIRELGLKNLKE